MTRKVGLRKALNAMSLFLNDSQKIRPTLTDLKIGRKLVLSPSREDRTSILKTCMSPKKLDAKVSFFKEFEEKKWSSFNVAKTTHNFQDLKNEIDDEVLIKLEETSI